MAVPMNISIPPLNADERVEEWQPLFVAATSSLAAQSGERAAVLILPSVCRNEYERDTALLAIKEETIETAFKVLCNALDPPIDELEAIARFRSMSWARGVRIEVFFILLWKEAKRDDFLNRQVFMVLTTQLPSKALSGTKKWIQQQEDHAVTDKQMREFLGMVQQNLRQSDIPLDYGFREPEDRSSFCKVVEQDRKEDDNQLSSDSYTEPRAKEVYKIHHPAAGQQRGRYRGISRYSSLTCFTCGKKGHGYATCPDRVCSQCHKKGHDRSNCPSADWGPPRNTILRERDYVKKVKHDGLLTDEESASIIVKVRGLPVRALLDTGAKVNVMDIQTMRGLGVSHCLNPRGGQVYGVAGTPVAIVGTVEIPIELRNQDIRWVQVHVLEGEEQALLLGRQFLKFFGRVTLDWEAGTIMLGTSGFEIQEMVAGGNPISRARMVRRIDDDSLKLLMDGHKTDLKPKQRGMFVDMLREFEGLFNDKPGRTPGCEHVIDTGSAAPRKSRPRRMPPRWEEEITTQLNELLEQGLCRPSNSPWASNVVLVTKKDGRQRLPSIIVR